MTVFCGFLGAGKTTLLTHLLTQAAGRKWAVVVNDVASLNIDVSLVRGSEGGDGAGSEGRKIIDLGNGCVCCSSRDELGEALAELAATGDYEHILVETTGVAEPRGVAALFTQKNPFGRSLSDFARLSALVSVIDAAHFLREWRAYQERGHREFPAPGGTRPVFELMLEQAECADVLVLNKCDLAPETELAELEGVLRGLNERAEIVRAEQGRVDEGFLLGRRRFDAQETLKAATWLRTLNRLAPAGGAAGVAGVVINARKAATTNAVPEHERKFGIRTVIYQARRPFVEEKLRAFLVNEAEGLLRAKGFFWTRERPDEMGFLSVAGGVARMDYLNYWWAALVGSGKVRMDERPEAIQAVWAEPQGDRRQELVFIGTGLEEGKITAALEACLA
ncbi:GTP-binding protein [Nibricoccus aquaticus]|uniref:GTP-binding protein n=1 Tax=Nibricoccus aquaticus TaxID=2576891 RepID=UPI00158641DA|nr:GTP-binding protein [Nibricoccus aquaticus]